jgi:hypothetical protein
VIEWVCQNWKAQNGVKCHDVKSRRRRHSHTPMLFSDDIIDIVMQAVIGPNATRYGDADAWMNDL